MGKKAHIIKKFLSKGYSEYFLSKLWIKEKNTRKNNGRRKTGFDNLNSNIDFEYMMSIFPDNRKCPVFGFQMHFKGNLDYTPTIDRINPYEGYVKGNVIWISII